MSRFGLVSTGSDSWILLRTPPNEATLLPESGNDRLSERAVAHLRKTSVHPELWFFQSAGDPHMVPIIAEDYYMACKKFLLQIEENEIRKEDLVIYKDESLQ